MHWDLSGLQTNMPQQTQDPLQAVTKMLQSQVALQTTMDIQEQLDDKALERKLTREQLKQKLLAGMPDAAKDPNYKQKLLDRLSDPNWIANLKGLEPEDKELMLTTMLTMSAGEGQGGDSMIPMLRLMSRQQAPSAQQLTVKDVVDIMQALKTTEKPTTDPLQWVSVIKAAFILLALSTNRK
jgi:hypothetical protein